MDPLTADDITRSFANTSRRQVATMNLPPLGGLDWDALDFLGWRDKKAPARAYVVTPRPDGPVGLELRVSTASESRRGSGLCDLCHCAQPADLVSLFVARRGGKAGRRGDSVGTYVCGDLRCSLYLRGKLPLDLPQGETLPVAERTVRLRTRLDAFVDRVLRA